MAVGFGLLLVSWLTLLLMVIGRLQNSLFLSLLSYGLGLAGLVIGLFGVASYVRRRLS